jgi:hypothetical protein
MPATSKHQSLPILYCILSPLQYSSGLTLLLFDRLKSGKWHNYRFSHIHLHVIRWVSKGAPLPPCRQQGVKEI